MCQKINRGCANSKYVTRNHHLEQELREIFGSSNGFLLELITFEILAAERLRLMGFDNRLIIDCFANVVNIHSELGKHYLALSLHQRWCHT